MILSVLFTAAILNVQSEPSRPVASTPTSERSNPERMICKRERIVGSNRPQRICMTARERDAIRDASRNQIDRVQEQPAELPRMGG